VPANQRRPWTEEDITKLKSMAGRLPAKDIAVKLGRSLQATVAIACKLSLPLRTRAGLGRLGRSRVAARLR
jgi:hypothetical protein